MHGVSKLVRILECAAIFACFEGTQGMTKNLQYTKEFSLLWTLQDELAQKVLLYCMKKALFKKDTYKSILFCVFLFKTKTKILYKPPKKSSITVFKTFGRPPKNLPKTPPKSPQNIPKIYQKKSPSQKDDQKSEFVSIQYCTSAGYIYGFDLNPMIVWMKM